MVPGYRGNTVYLLAVINQADIRLMGRKLENFVSIPSSLKCQKVSKRYDESVNVGVSQSNVRSVSTPVRM